MNNQQPQLDEVKRAIDAQQSHTTAPALRHRMYDFLENATSSISVCHTMGLHFIQNEQADAYRLFGYHCVRKLCKKWPSLSASQTSSLRTLALQLFGAADNAPSALFREKISELIVTLAAKSWAQSPSQWTD